MKDFIKAIQGNSYYQIQMCGQKPVILYDDHRFVVPILWLAREMRVIDPTINMVRFDGHFDALDFKPPIGSSFQDSKSFNEVFHFCRDHLGPIDDDWQTFVFDQGLVNKALIFCDRKDEKNPKYTDRFFCAPRLEDAIDYKFVWEQNQVLLDIDCDYFTFLWRGSIFPWQEEFYQKEFSSNNFMRTLIEKAPFVTVCFEPDFCGGRDNANKIWNKINQLFFQ